jgi:hypothetical protein
MLQEKLRRNCKRNEMPLNLQNNVSLCSVKPKKIIFLQYTLHGY